MRSAAVAAPPAPEAARADTDLTESAKASGSGYDWRNQWYPVRVPRPCPLMRSPCQQPPHSTLPMLAYLLSMSNTVLFSGAPQQPPVQLWRLVTDTTAPGIMCRYKWACSHKARRAAACAGALCAGCPGGPAAARVAV